MYNLFIKESIGDFTSYLRLGDKLNRPKKELVYLIQ